jgi:hypothetical protein
MITIHREKNTRNRNVYESIAASLRIIYPRESSPMSHGMTERSNIPHTIISPRGNAPKKKGVCRRIMSLSNGYKSSTPTSSAL